jgi:hypothetical protein
MRTYMILKQFGDQNRSRKASSKCLASTSLLYHRVKGATPSNCGNLLKIQLLTLYRKVTNGQGNDLGSQNNCKIVTQSKNVEYASDYNQTKWTIRSQVPTFAEANASAERDAVHRLNVGGFPTALCELSRPMQWGA